MLFGEFVDAEKLQFKADDNSIVNMLAVTYADIDENGKACRKTKTFNVSMSNTEATEVFLRMREGDRFACECKVIKNISKVTLLEDLNLFGEVK